MLTLGLLGCCRRQSVDTDRTDFELRDARNRIEHRVGKLVGRSLSAPVEWYEQHVGADVPADAGWQDRVAAPRGQKHRLTIPYSQTARRIGMHFDERRRIGRGKLSHAAGLRTGLVVRQ